MVGRYDGSVGLPGTGRLFGGCGGVSGVFWNGDSDECAFVPAQAEAGGRGVAMSKVSQIRLGRAHDGKRRVRLITGSGRGRRTLAAEVLTSDSLVAVVEAAEAGTLVTRTDRIPAPADWPETDE